MHKSNNRSWLAPASAIAIVIAATPFALVAQDTQPPQALRQFSASDLVVMSPSKYERGKAELVLFNIAYAEKDFDEARQHLSNALESGGLDAEETAGARAQPERSARLGTAPPE
jgi:hypothetical protein